jgi:hypothetical protein
VPVFITVETKGQTQQGYDGMPGFLADAIMQSPGFVLHPAHAVKSAWRAIEVCESKTGADQFFAKTLPLSCRQESDQNAHFRNCTA